MGKERGEKGHGGIRALLFPLQLYHIHIVSLIDAVHLLAMQW